VLFRDYQSLGPELRARGFSITEFDLELRRIGHLIKAFQAIKSYRKKAPYRILWSQLGFSNLLCAMVSSKGGLPHVATFRSEGYMRRRKWSLKSRSFAFLERIFLKNSTRVAVSSPVAEDWKKFFGWNSFEVINDGVDISLVPPMPSDARKAEIRALYNVSPDDTLLVVPARLTDVKGHKYLIEALSILKERHGLLPLVLAFGNGTLKESLTAQATERGVRFVIHAAMPQPDLFAIMQSAECVVMPSLGETFGNSAAEAMLLGVPVVLSRTDGFSEIIGDSGCALMAPIADAEGLSEAIRLTITDPVATRARVAQSRARALDMFTLDGTANKWAALFRLLTP
jgi:glycosyltransferase involved in cell wall biosynthesis